MTSAFVNTGDATLVKTENEIVTVLIHAKKLRLKNRLCSPLLRLLIETIVHVLSYVMTDMEHSFVWRSIFTTRYHIHIMYTTTEVWQKADFTPGGRLAQLVFARSRGNLEAIIANLLMRDDRRDGCARNALEF